MQKSVRLKLSFLMFMEYFIWGAWYVTMGTYLFANLDASAVQVGSSYANLAIAAIISPFFVGLIADRYFEAQKIIGVLHIAGAIVLYYVSTVTDFNEFWWLILLYTILYMPTMALANSISFHQIKDGGKEFPMIRVFGTLGWIAAGLLIGFTGLESSVLTFQIAAIGSLILGVFSFLLPRTPVKEKVNTSLSSILGLDALVLFKSRSFVVFFLASIAVCIPLSFYYSFANPFLNDIGMENSAAKMTLGQISEFAFMLLIPLLFRKLGVKKIIMIGILAWILRYLMFAFGNIGANVWMLYMGIALHGICYDFFFVTGQIYTDKKAGKFIKSSAQGMLTFATYGVGMLIGSYLSGILTEEFVAPSTSSFSYDWNMVWIVPCIISVLILLLFTLFFKQNKTKELPVTDKILLKEPLI
ncbi:Putative nucleoside transporter YegT [Arenibacter antarcticus]|nr:nucleoside permease [Arenibacter sp. H213]MCM4167112.1 MFS transporter [Arenibacter sp. H213]